MVGRKMRTEVRSLGLWQLVIAAILVLAASSPSSAQAAFAIESPGNEFSGSGEVRLSIFVSGVNSVKCKKSVVKGVLLNPPSNTAKVTEWKPSECTVYNEMLSPIGPATVQIYAPFLVEAVSTTKLHISFFYGKATFALPFEGQNKTCEIN